MSFELTLSIALLNILSSTLVHPPFASSRRTHNENTKISLKRLASDLSTVSLASRNSRESSNRSRHVVPCSAKMRSSSQMIASFLSSHVYLGRYFSMQKSVLLYSEWEAQLIGRSGYRQPIPVCLKRKDLKGELERAIHSTYMHQNRGTCTCAFDPLFVFPSIDRPMIPLALSSFPPSPKRQIKPLQILKPRSRPLSLPSGAVGTTCKASASSRPKALLYPSGRANLVPEKARAGVTLPLPLKMTRAIMKVWCLKFRQKNGKAEQSPDQGE